MPCCVRLSPQCRSHRVWEDNHESERDLRRFYSGKCGRSADIWSGRGVQSAGFGSCSHLPARTTPICVSFIAGTAKRTPRTKRTISASTSMRDSTGRCGGATSDTASFLRAMASGSPRRMQPAREYSSAWACRQRSVETKPSFLVRRLAGIGEATGLAPPETGIGAARGEKIAMASLLDDAAMVEHDQP